MSIVDQIDNLCKNIEEDENYKRLESALKEYYKLLEEGIIIPRENKLLNNYTTILDLNKLEYSNIKNEI